MADLNKSDQTPMERTIADVVATIEAGEFYQNYDQSVADLRILRAAIGTGGQPIDQGLRDAAKAMGAEVARNVPVVGSQPHPADERVASAMMLEAGAKLAAYAFDEDEEIEFSREDAVFVLSALSAKEV